LPYRKSIRDTSISQHLTPPPLLLLLLQFVHFHGMPASVAGQPAADRGQWSGQCRSVAVNGLVDGRAAGRDFVTTLLVTVHRD